MLKKKIKSSFYDIAGDIKFVEWRGPGWGKRGGGCCLMGTEFQTGNTREREFWGGRGAGDRCTVDGMHAAGLQAEIC